MRHYYALWLCLAFWLCSIALPSTSLAQTTQGLVADSTELRVLRQFYYSTGGPQWSQQGNWLQGNTLAEAGTWAGVTVSNGDVTELLRYGITMNGTLPASLGLLTQLQNLQLGNMPLLTGPLPPQIGQLRQLRTIALFSTGLTGPLPIELGSLTNLTYFSVYNSRFSGPIPASLGNLSNLTYLSLGDDFRQGPGQGNEFNGPIPASLGQLSQLNHLEISLSPIGGTVPAELGNLTNLTFLELDGCQFTGALPTSFLQLSKLNRLIINNNALTSLPNWRQLPNPGSFGPNVSQNELTFGTLERHFTGAGQHPYQSFNYSAQRAPAGTDTVRFTAGDTLRLERSLGGKKTHYQWERQVQGQWQDVAGATDSVLIIAAADTSARGLYRTRATNDWVTGVTITSKLVYAKPVADGQLQALRDLYEATDGDHWTRRDNWPSGDAAWKAIRSVSQCQGWFGLEIQGEKVRGVYLENNHLHGQLPASIGQLRELDYLLLSHNELSGQLPHSLGELSKLTYLYIPFNDLTGYLPPTLGKLPVRQIGFHNNRLTGPIPAEFGQLTRLESLYLMHNELTGDFPVVLTQLPNLQDLWLDYNHLTGSLPEEIGQLTHLRGLGVIENRLSGPVPASLTQLPLQALYLSGNAFTDLPRWVGATHVPADLYVSNNQLSFAPLERNFPAAGVQIVPEFYYHNQRTPAGVDTVYFKRGSTPELQRMIGGQYNYYVWEFKQGTSWVELSGTDTVYRVSQASEVNEGEYRVRVRNTWVPNLTLYSRPVYLSMIPYAELTYNEPEANCLELVDAPPAAADTALTEKRVNYVRTYSARQAFTAPDALLRADSAGVQVTTEYLDGLGRPVQTVLRQESPTGRDIVQPIEYDALGRQAKQYLPYTAAATDTGSFRPNAILEQYGFYRGGSNDPAVAGLTQYLPKTGAPFSATAFEASPLNRPTLQGAPGENWQLNRHVIQLEERPNSLQDSVQRWVPGYGTEREDLSIGGAYGAGELWVRQTRDEQGQWAQEFTDKEGHVVLKQVGVDGSYQQVATQWLKTYYVYDDFGRLRAVLPPKAVQRLRKNGQIPGTPGPAWSVVGAGVERLLFRYHYDEQARLIEKKVPDQDGYAHTVYDELDRPILTQDAAQQANKEWVATKYDALGRVVYTALVRFPEVSGLPDAQRNTLQQQAAATTTLWEAPTPVATLTKAYYSNNAFPQLPSAAQLLTVSYYDSYDFNQDGTAEAQYQAPSASELACQPSEVPQVDLRVTGQATRALVRVLGVPENESGAWLTTTTFYDEKLRPIQVQSTNARGGTDVVTSRYDFTGKALSSYAVHQVPGQPERRVREQSIYDHAGRLLSVTQELDGAKPQVLARHTYNELGQLEKKELGGSLPSGVAVTPPLPTAVGPASLQTVDYRYNIRGWLTKINDVQNPDPRDLWSFSLSYDCGFNTPQFNGNIAGQTWRSASDGIERAYGYRYDHVNRLLQGDFVARTSQDPTSSWKAERSNYRFSFASYDAGGNLLTLRRRGLVQAATRSTPAQYAETDNLRYRYEPASSEPASNRLQRVDDLAPAATSFGAKLPERPDFSDGQTTGSTTPDYTYDAAGSMLSDRNKGITRIQYNHLHLPELIEWSNGNKLQYFYTATGQKVAKLATEMGKPTPVRTDYLGAWQYERDSLRWLTHAEGRALMLYHRDPAGQVRTKVQYEYTLKDHLGNLRVAFHPGERKTYRAMLDSDPAQISREQQEFDSVSVSAPIRQVVGQQFAHGGDGVALLNAGGAQPRPLGPLKQLAVAKSDTLVVTAFGMYQQAVNTNNSWAFSLASFVASLLQQPAATMPTSDGTRRIRVLPLLSAGLTAASLPVLQQLTGGVPKAYLRVLVFNSDSMVVANQPLPKQLTVSAKGGYEQLQLTVVVPQDGYVQAYVANESDIDVFFDDITVEHRQALQVQENQYDPYGLDLAGLSKTATPQNQYTWNGKEKQTEFGLNWHDHGWRFYDPSLGRWVVSDPDAEEADQEGWGTYQFGMDNAIRYNDLDGREPGPGDGDDGEGPSLTRSYLEFHLGSMVAFLDNTTGINLRSTYTALDPQAYNSGQDAGDLGSEVFGTAEAALGANAIEAGLVAAPVSGGTTLTVSATGLAATLHGGIVAIRANSNLRNQKGRQQSSTSNTGRPLPQSQTADGRAYNPQKKQPIGGSGKARPVTVNKGTYKQAKDAARNSGASGAKGRAVKHLQDPKGGKHFHSGRGPNGKGGNRVNGVKKYGSRSGKVGNNVHYTYPSGASN